MKKILYIFSQLREEDIDWFITHGHKKQIAAGEVLIKKKRPIDHIYIVLSGVLSIRIGVNENREIDEAAEGEILGEMSFVTGVLPYATVIAREDTVVSAIPRKVIAKKIEADDGFAARFFKAISIFLADRIRANIGLLGFGEIAVTQGELADIDDIDPVMVENIDAARQRFEGMQKKMGL